MSDGAEPNSFYYYYYYYYDYYYYYYDLDVFKCAKFNEYSAT